MRRGALAIAWRDFRSAFDGPLAYVVIAAFVGVSGAVFVSLLSAFSNLSLDLRTAAEGREAALAAVSLDSHVVAPTLRWVVLFLMVLVPLLTMRLLAEEQRQGTLELLLTAPLTPADLVLGKFLGGLLLALTPIALTAWYPLVLAIVAFPDPAPLLAGYLGLALVAAAFTSVGLLMSSLTDSALLAAFLTFTALVLSAFAGVLSLGVRANWGAVLAELSILRHYDGLATGVLDTGDLAWLVLFTAAMLFLTHRVIESRRWR